MRFTIKLKLALAFALIIILSGGMATMAISQLSTLNDAITDIVQSPATNLRNSGDLSVAVLNSIASEKSAALNEDSSRISTYVDSARAERAKVSKILADLEHETNPAVRSKVEEIKAAIPAWEKLQEDVLRFAMEDTPEGDRQAGVITMGEGEKATRKLLTILEALNREIERIDLGIRTMRVESGPNGPVALFTHEGHDGPMPLVLESHGTRMFLRLYPFLLRALETGGIAVMDELDTAIHPLILPEILRWFYDPSRNPHDAQLWMTCHNASLLEELIKEEVLFCTKSPDGRTEVYALQDVQAVRRDENYYRKYLGGTYGALPQIG